MQIIYLSTEFNERKIVCPIANKLYYSIEMQTLHPLWFRYAILSF